VALLLSRSVVRRKPGSLLSTRNNVLDRTASGIDADTVMPTLSTRYREEAPKIMPSSAPATTAGQVNSGSWTSSGTYGLCAGVASTEVTWGVVCVTGAAM